jgi:hypothetical protein
MKTLQKRPKKSVQNMGGLGNNCSRTNPREVGQSTQSFGFQYQHATLASIDNLKAEDKAVEIGAVALDISELIAG